MNNIKLLIVLLLFALLGMGGCSDEKDWTEEQQQFLGQWKEIARGNDMYPELPPSGEIIEFLPDWTFKRSNTARYSIDSKILYLNYPEKENYFTYRYIFYEDTLRLDYLSGNIDMSTTAPTFNIYKQIK